MAMPETAAAAMMPHGIEPIPTLAPLFNTGDHKSDNQQALPNFLQYVPEIAEWSAIDPSSVVTADFRSKLITRYRAFHNLENESVGPKSVHNSLTDAIYSRYNLPVLAVIHEHAQKTGDREALLSSSIALYVLDQALTVLDRYIQQNGVAESTAFAHMRFHALRGRMDYPTFLNLMNCAKYAASSCITTHADRMNAASLIPLPNNGHETFGTIAEKAKQEFMESENGVDLDDAGIREKLLDAKTKTLVLSIDFNSTLNNDESYASLPLLDNTTALLQVLVKDFKTRFPDKKILIVLNTGRPAMYLWGGMEALPPIPEMRELCLTESGGVIMHMEGTQPHTEVAVESPHLWKEQLTGIKNYLLGFIKNKHTVLIEPKDSMLSIRLAQKAEAGGQLLHHAITGEKITPEWIAERIQEYLLQTQATFTHQFRQLEHAIKEAPEITTKIEQFLKSKGRGDGDAILNQSDELNPEFLEELHEIFHDAEEHRIHELADITSALQTIAIMKTKLKPKFNATAGYIDIGHGDLNKYSTLIRVLERKWGLSPDEAIIVHIGDSSTDIIPTNETAEGEINHGADNVFLVGVGNSSSSLREAIKKRDKHGLITAHPSVHGLSNFIFGLTKQIY